MNSGKKVKKFNTSPNPNTTVCLASASGATCKTKRMLNETFSAGPIRKPNLLSKKAQENENATLELTFAYNEYLQSLMKKMIVERTIKKNKEIIDGQLEYYGQLLSQKQDELNRIVEDTQWLQKQEQIIEVLKSLEETIKKIKLLYEGHQIKGSLQNLKEILQTECQKLFLKNVKPIKTQQEYDNLLSVLEKLLATMEKFVKSDRNFDEINKFAEEIRNFFEIHERFSSAHAEVLQDEKDAITGLIANLSDMFSKKYEGGNFLKNPE